MPIPGDSEDDTLLFELPPKKVPQPAVNAIGRPIWTENKARLIERYLYYFVMVTKHGTYIDGFAGPQSAEHSYMWSARLVLESRPRWFRNFHLYDIDEKQVARLEEMVAGQPPRDRSGKEPKRTVLVHQGDFNVLVSDLLGSGAIPEKEATFCLLDQRTFECHWATLESLARYKQNGANKIELFYFLPSGWLDRSLNAVTKSHQKVLAWWGRDDWRSLLGMNRYDRAQLFSDRIRKELGYWSVSHYPIYERADSTRIMYYMIHATDHPEAPKLMRRAYGKAVGPEETLGELKQEFLFMQDS